jgi:hypothetical protein
MRFLGDGQRETMIFRGISLRELFAILAVLASVLWLGHWDNLRAIERVLGGGYETIATVTAIHHHRRLPLAFDGLRPRLLGEGQSLDLKWRGRDGVVRERLKTPVTAAYLSRISVQDRIVISLVTIKVIDEEGAAPVLLHDAPNRLASITASMNQFATGAAILWPLLACNLLWRWARRRQLAAVHGAKAKYYERELRLPGALAIIALLTLALSGYEGYRLWSEYREHEILMKQGVEAPARISSVGARKEGASTSYAIDLAWKDRSGSDRRYAAARVSPAFWRQITRDGALVASTTNIRYLEQDQSVRPVVVADPGQRRPAHPDQNTVLIVAALNLILVIATLLLSRFAYTIPTPPRSR